MMRWEHFGHPQGNSLSLGWFQRVPALAQAVFLSAVQPFSFPGQRVARGFPLLGSYPPTGSAGSGLKWSQACPHLPHLGRAASVLGRVLIEERSEGQRNVMLESTVFTSILSVFPSTFRSSFPTSDFYDCAGGPGQAWRHEVILTASTSGFSAPQRPESMGLRGPGGGHGCCSQEAPLPCSHSLHPTKLGSRKPPRDHSLGSASKAAASGGRKRSG